MASLADFREVPSAEHIQRDNRRTSIWVGARYDDGTMDDYLPLDATNCASVGSEVYRLTGFDIISPPDVLESARWLAWTAESAVSTE